MSDPNQGVPYFPDFIEKSSIRVFDEGMVSWLSGMRFRRQTPSVVTSWLSKQWSQKKDLHTDKTQKAAMPYPMVSLTVGTITPDIERRNVNQVRTGPNGTMFLDNKNTKAALVPWPLPILIPYQIDIWTKTRQDLRYLETAVMERFVFSDTTYVNFDFGEGYGEKIVRLTLDSVDDTSDLETGEKERELRKTISTTLHGWIFLTPEIVKTVQQYHIVYIDADDGKLDDQTFLDHFCNISNYNFNSDYSQIISINESPAHAPPENRVLLWLSYGEDGLVGTGP